MKNIISILLLSILLSSCVEEIDEKYYPESSKKPVATTFIQALDDTLEMYLEYSKPLFEEYDYQTTAIENASVKIKGQNSYSLQYDSSINKYIAAIGQNELHSGVNLELEINHDDFETLTAYTTIPGKSNHEIEHISTISGDQYSVNHTFSYKNNRNEKCYIKINASDYSTYGYYRNLGDYFFEVDKNETVYFKVNSYLEGKGSTMYFNIYNCDKNYYLYQESVTNYTGDFFLTAPSQIYSNIKNGLGVFSSYYLSKDSINLN